MLVALTVLGRLARGEGRTGLGVMRPPVELPSGLNLMSPLVASRPQNRAQQVGEIEPDLSLDLDLVDAGELIFNRVFDRDDVARDRVELEQSGVERRGFA